MSRTTSDGFLAPCQNLAKTNDTIPKRPDRRKDGRKEERTDRPYFVGPFRLPTGVQKDSGMRKKDQQRYLLIYSRFSRMIKSCCTINRLLLWEQVIGPCPMNLTNVSKFTINQFILFVRKMSKFMTVTLLQKVLL